MDIVNAINAQNLILPTGTAKLGTLEYMVEMNGSPQTIAGLNDLPVKTVNGATIYMRDVAHIRDGFSPQTNIVRANGQRGVLDGGVQDRLGINAGYREPRQTNHCELRRLHTRRLAHRHAVRPVAVCARFHLRRACVKRLSPRA